jgi:hypothetical protein
MTRPELDRVRGRRSTLYHATLVLEEALAGPSGDLGRWWSNALVAARALGERITEHIEESERPGEFLDSIASEAPRLVNSTRQLVVEHGELGARVGALIQMLDKAPPVGQEEVVDEIREAGLGLLGLLVRHRQKGADLSYLAYQEDLGSSG